jgi:hypothetical protein
VIHFLNPFLAINECCKANKSISAKFFNNANEVFIVGIPSIEVSGNKLPVDAIQYSRETKPTV